MRVARCNGDGPGAQSSRSKLQRTGYELAGGVRQTLAQLGHLLDRVCTIEPGRDNSRPDRSARQIARLPQLPA
jgi:hypothetical protein